MLGILCGLETEAALARSVRGALVACSAARPEVALSRAHGLVQEGATRLLSFGLAGALNPGVAAGAIVMGRMVQSGTMIWDCDKEWLIAMDALLPGMTVGPVWGSDEIIAKAAAKRRLFERSRCVCADMESHYVAEAAAEANIPFIVLRVITDTADMDLPPVAMTPLQDDGRVNAGRIMMNVLGKPAQIPSLIHLGQNTAKALKALKKVAKALDAF